MPTNFTPLLTAWALTIIIIMGGVMVLELTYDPEAAIAAAVDNASVETADGGEPGSQNIDSPDAGTDVQDPTNAGQNSAAVEAGGQLPAPGQNTAAVTPAVASPPPGLPIKPIAELLENTSEGPLPKIGDDGRVSYNVYAAPRNSDITLSRIAILVTDLGKKANNTKRAVQELPAEISLGFSVYGRDLHSWGQQARSAGHEVLLAIPMEPTGYPQNDPGPLTLLTSNAASQNARLLRSSLARFSGYVGVVNLNGSRFIAASDSIRPVLDELKRRGLMFVDNRDSK
ncbi:MAG: divergent polysaccharide deacetylase family protein, partial [Kordiimonadaceae bacterium]|nr:divergent polysaccharide deacetylase family protein [Kordiimonadaceae bacterium]